MPEVALGVMPGAGGTQRAPRLLGATIVASGLTPGERYTLLTFNHAAAVPTRNFLAATGAIARIAFVANASEHRQRELFMSNSTTFFRVVHSGEPTSARQPSRTIPPVVYYRFENPLNPGEDTMGRSDLRPPRPLPHRAAPSAPSSPSTAGM